MGAVNNDGIFVIDNVFYHSAASLLKLTDYTFLHREKLNQPIFFSGNTYAQSVDQALCVFDGRYYYPGTTWEIQKFLALIGDAQGTVVRLP